MLQWLLGLLFPIQCVGGCGRYDQWLCPVCAASALQPRLVSGASVGLPMFRSIYALGDYANPVLRRAIISLKYSGYFGIAQALGGAAQTIIPVGKHEYCVSVPLQPQRQRERGFNQTELIARRLGMPLLPLLRKTKRTARQASLNRAERLQNLQAAFTVDARLAEQARGRRLLLVDDVLSTGATLAACAATLNGVSYTVIDALVIALNTERPR
jgi:ComF family protein